MPIRIEHGKPSTILTATQLAGEARKQEDIQKMQMEFDYRQSLRQQDMAIDLQTQERAKQWEIDKMQLRSQIDFQREEQVRQRKLDSLDSAIQQIDKEVLAGRITEQEAYPLKQKLELNKLGVNVPVSAFPGDEEEEFGVRPYWMRGKEAGEGTPERQLYEAKLAEGISGERRGTIPYYLDPEWLRANRDIAMQVLESRGIMLEEDEIDAWIEREKGEEITVISSTGEEGTIPIGDLEEALAEGYTIVKTQNAELPLDNKQLDVGVRSEPVGVKERLEAGEAKFHRPSLSTFLTMSPLRALMERRRAKRLVR